MMFREAYFKYITNNFTLAYPLRYGEQEYGTADGYTMQVISDPEQPAVLCDEQGNAGLTLFQFDFHGSNQAGEMNQFLAENELDLLKEQIKTISGRIDVDGETFDVWTSTISAPIESSDADNGFFGSLFTCVVPWSRVV